MRASGVAITIIVVIVVFTGLMAAFWLASYRQLSTGTFGSQITTAIVGAVAAFMTALITLFGLFLKESADARSERRLQAEAEQSRAMQRDAENRLKLEAAIRAVQLLGNSEGRMVPSIQRAGALLALSNLAEHSLTLALLTELMATEGIFSNCGRLYFE